MIKKYRWSILFFFLFLGLYSCDINANSGNSEKQKSIITVYGSENCGHCKQLKIWLDKKKLEYTFHDVRVDKDAMKEMLTRVKDAKLKGRVLYPVVVIDGEVFIRPESETIESRLKK